jgi:hypothetical protein
MTMFLTTARAVYTNVSARGGTVRPSVLAVLRLITNSTLELCWMGRSAGFGTVENFSDVDARALK